MSSSKAAAADPRLSLPTASEMSSPPPSYWAAEAESELEAEARAAGVPIHAGGGRPDFPPAVPVQPVSVYISRGPQAQTLTTVYVSSSGSSAGQQAPYYPATGAPTLQPIPVSAFREEQAQVAPPSDELSVTATRLELHSSPSCDDVVFMLPFPFFCLGCWLSNTADAVFDDTTKTATLQGYPGYCCCLKSVKTIPYSNIANVALVRTNMTKNKVSTYKLTLLMRDGETVAMSGPCYMDELEAKAKTLHHFLFGRGNPGYRSPSMFELLL